MLQGKKIAKLEAQIKEMRAEDVKNPKKKKVVYGCKNSKSQGKGRSCSHCFVCGESGHKVSECPVKKEKDKESNSNRTSERD